MESKENLANIYLEMLSSTKNISVTLSKFFWELFEKEPNKKDIVLISKAVKVYGRDIVFLSLLDMYDMPDIRLDSFYPLLAYFCKKRLMEISNSIPSSIDLTTDINNMKALLAKERKRKLKIKDPFHD